MSLRRFILDEEQEELERRYREAFELDDDEPIDISDFEIWRRQQYQK